MKKNRSVHALLAFLLLGSIVLNNTVTCRQSIPLKCLNHRYEVQVRTQNNSGGLDVGKAD